MDVDENLIAEAMSPLGQKMRSYVESHYPILYLVTFEDEKGDDLIRELAGERKVFEWNMAHGCVSFETKSRKETKGTAYMDLPAALENWLDQELDHHFLVIRNAHLALRDAPLAISRLRALVRKIVNDDDTVATIFMVSSQSCVPPELEKFITVFDQGLPDEKEISRIIHDHCTKHEHDVDKSVADKLILALHGLSEYEITRLLNRGFRRDGIIGDDDIDLVIEEKKQIVRKNGILEMVSVKDGFASVGGLEELKEWLMRKAMIIQYLSKARGFGVDTPQGVMIAGMPGCGKSLTARAASKEFRLPLLQLDIGSLMGRYVGDSEANMRRALSLAETVSPCILLVEELEKAFAGIGGGTSTSSEITRRLFGYFLTWMQENTKPVFVVATANDVSDLPPELLRKVRFDEFFYVDFPNPKERTAILKVHLKKRNKAPSRSMKKLIEMEKLIDMTVDMTDGFSGADLEGVVKDAVELAFLDRQTDLKTAHILKSVKKNEKRAMMMKGKAEEYRKRLKEMGFRSASGTP